MKGKIRENLKQKKGRERADKNKEHQKTNKTRKRVNELEVSWSGEQTLHFCAQFPVTC